MEQEIQQVCKNVTSKPRYPGYIRNYEEYGSDDYEYGNDNYKNIDDYDDDYDYDYEDYDALLKEMLSYKK